MDKTEPALVPEWLKSSGSSTRNHQPASPSQAEKFSSTKHSRNRSSVNSSGNDLGRSFVSDQATSSYFRRSSSGKGSSHLRSYSGVGRNRDRVLDDFHDFQDKDRSILGEPRHRNYSDSLEVMLPGKSDKDILRRSHSMTHRKQDEPWPRKVASELSNTNNIGPGSSNILLAGGTAVSGVGKTIFERDFPSLGSEEKWGDSMIGRVPSPGLSSAVQRLPSPSSDLLGADRWNSVLADVPGLTGSSNASSLSSQQTGSGTAPSLAQSSTALNMAEAVAQMPSRAHSTPQLSVDTLRLEELAIRQSKLIPVLPSTSKSLERGKSRQQHPQSALAQIRSGSGKPDAGRTSNSGKLLVLKQPREDGVSASAKDILSPKNGVRIQSSPSLLASSTSALASPTAFKSPSNSQNLAGSERKLSSSSKILERRPSSHAQSRNDFFNLIKQKSSSTAPSASTSSDRSVSPTVSEKSDDVMTEAVAKSENKHGSSLDDSLSVLSVENGGRMANNCGVSGSTNLIRKGEQHSVCDALSADEKEVAFLRSLGWEETAGEDEGLTEEEISTFYEKFMKQSPAVQLQEKILLQLQANGVNCSGSSSQGRSSDEPQMEL